MKRLFAFALVLVMVLSLSITVFATDVQPAAETVQTGSITINNATIGQTYRVFKIFNASYAADAQGHPILDQDGKPKIAYTIKTTDKFFDVLFGTNGTGSNYFNYIPETGEVNLKNGISDGQLINYLTKLIADHVDAGERLSPETEPLVADSTTVVFENLSTGYYVIDRGILSTITLDTNAHNVTVIDKNQKPGSGFDKLIMTEGGLKESTSASVGDKVEWDISFGATNHDGKELVEYYAVRDIKSPALWVEFDDISVSLQISSSEDDTSSIEQLQKGYYHYAGPGDDTNEWALLGPGWDPTVVAEVEADNSKKVLYKDQADWYLVHYGYDDFEIVIPWLNSHTFTGKTNDTLKGYELTFPKDATGKITATSRYAPTVTVHVNYSAVVGPDASLSGANNSVSLDWKTVSNTYGPDTPEKTQTYVYNIGISKVANDGAGDVAATPLAGAEFELYWDEECTDPVYVIPTGKTGVYVLDDVFSIISGVNRTTSREKYGENAWKAYLEDTTKAKEVTKNIDGVDYTETVRSDMTTPASGKIVVLGLKAGTYYLKETKAPDGFNKLSDEVPAKVAIDGSQSATYTVDGVSYAVYTTEVINNQGVELPSTGGQGTMMMITIGTMIAMAFAVLLITHKKMSVYED